MQRQLEGQEMPKTKEKGKMWEGQGGKKLPKNLWKMLSKPQKWTKYKHFFQKMIF